MDVKAALAVMRKLGLEAGKRFTILVTKNQKVPEHSVHYCRDCESYHEMCVVENEVWDIIRGDQPNDIVLCFPCMEKRLGRKITLEDLKHCPCNAPYFIGFQRGNS